MQIRVLGCSGGIGGGRHTTSLLLDEDVLIDAGTGVSRLTLDELGGVDHVFITHAHLDHILSLPLLLDSVAGDRRHPVTVHGLPEVLQTIKDHIFNWHIWPDFARIPSAQTPLLTYQPSAMGQPASLGKRRITPIPANHVVPACGYLIQGEGGSLLFSGDTASNASLWAAAASTPDLRGIVVETSFPNALASLAKASLHYHPAALASELAYFKADVPLWITHLKPGSERVILDELRAALPGRQIAPLAEEQIFQF